MLLASSVITSTNVRVVDGDTLAINRQRYRLLAIDAPEMPGHCRKGRACAPGDPIASRTSLARLIEGKRVEMELVGIDRYRRPLVVARAGGKDLSCAQIRAGQAVYVAKWDNGRRAAKQAC